MGISVLVDLEDADLVEGRELGQQHEQQAGPVDHEVQPVVLGEVGGHEEPETSLSGSRVMELRN